VPKRTFGIKSTHPKTRATVLNLYAVCGAACAGLADIVIDPHRNAASHGCVLVPCRPPEQTPTFHVVAVVRPEWEPGRQSSRVIATPHGDCRSHFRWKHEQPAGLRAKFFTPRLILSRAVAPSYVYSRYRLGPCEATSQILRDGPRARSLHTLALINLKNYADPTKQSADCRLGVVIVRTTMPPFPRFEPIHGNLAVLTVVLSAQPCFHFQTAAALVRAL
jgi:hypothetical protein